MPVGNKSRSNVHHDALEFPDGICFRIAVTSARGGYRRRRATEQLNCRAPGLSQLDRRGRLTRLILDQAPAWSLDLHAGCHGPRVIDCALSLVAFSPKKKNASTTV